MEAQKPRIYRIPFASVYPLYVEKAVKKGRTQAEVDRVICWLTGYSLAELQALTKSDSDCENFVNQAPALNPNRRFITGVICGVRVEDIEDPTTQEIRYMDKLIDELAKDKLLDKILRTQRT